MSIKIKWNDGSRSRNRGEVNIETIHQALACTAQKTEPSNPQPCVMDLVKGAFLVPVHLRRRTQSIYSYLHIVPQSTG